MQHVSGSFLVLIKEHTSGLRRFWRSGGRSPGNDQVPGVDVE
jgi:hypothetical protein